MPQRCGFAPTSRPLQATRLSRFWMPFKLLPHVSILLRVHRVKPRDNYVFRSEQVSVALVPVTLQQLVTQSLARWVQAAPLAVAVEFIWDKALPADMTSRFLNRRSPPTQVARFLPAFRTTEFFLWRTGRWPKRVLTGWVRTANFRCHHKIRARKCRCPSRLK
jgi:hypothetical protein